MVLCINRRLVNYYVSCFSQLTQTSTGLWCRVWHWLKKPSPRWTIKSVNTRKPLVWERSACAWNQSLRAGWRRGSWSAGRIWSRETGRCCTKALSPVGPRVDKKVCDGSTEFMAVCLWLSYWPLIMCTSFVYSILQVFFMLQLLLKKANKCSKTTSVTILIINRKLI